MARDQKEELKQLKKDYFELEETRSEENECLMKVINTYGSLVATNDDLFEEVQALKELIKPDNGLPIDQIEEQIGNLKSKIITRETDNREEGDSEKLALLEDRLVEACRSIRRLSVALLEDFYPATEELSSKKEQVKIDCQGKIENIELKEPTEAFLAYIEGLKGKISEDFRHINNTFLSLLDEVKELELKLSQEFGGKEPLKQIEYFEMKINDQFGVIANSFNLYKNIDELKKVVFEKIKHIKSLLSLNKEREIKKAQKTRENIGVLRKRIARAEHEARKMSEKAEKFQTAAMQDGLTGLYNRNAFDVRVKDAFADFQERRTPFAIIVFDIDKFKQINDSLGHIAGDKVLKKVAQCLEESFRKDDFISRYGGDEFIVLIENMNEIMARKRINVFNSNLKKRKFVSYKEGEVAINVSSGISIVKEGDNPESLIARADQEMYAVKQQSR